MSAQLNNLPRDDLKYYSDLDDFLPKSAKSNFRLENVILKIDK